MTETQRFDVAIVGAGPAGLHAAASMARAGLSVLVIERNPRDQAGSRWVNGVPLWQFEAARCALPVGDEIFAEAQPFTMIAPDGSARVTVSDSAVYEIDMRHLGARLTRELEAAGGTCWWEHRAEALELDDDDRPRALTVVPRNAEAENKRVEASLFVDASGLGAVLRKQHPALSELCPLPLPEHLCRAAQEVRDITDDAAARAFLRERSGKPEESLSYVGVEGGYSLLRIGIDADLEHVSILTGSTAEPGLRSGRKILDDFAAEQSAWVGPARFGGQRAIPLRRPYAHLVAPGLALLGDAANQVFSAHGSGIGIGLVAAHLLAQAAIAGATRDPGALSTLWAYPLAFHRTYGGVFGASDLFRRFSQSVPAEGTTALIREGLLTPSMIADTLLQKPPRVQPAALIAQLRGALRVPRVSAGLIPTLAKMPAIYALARTFPKSPAVYSPALERYDHAMARLVGS